MRGFWISEDVEGGLLRFFLFEEARVRPLPRPRPGIFSLNEMCFSYVCTIYDKKISQNLLNKIKQGFILEEIVRY